MTSDASWLLRLVWDAELKRLLDSSRLDDLRRATTIAVAFPRLLTPEELSALHQRGNSVMDATVDLARGVKRFSSHIITHALINGADIHATHINDGVPFLCSLAMFTPGRMAGAAWYDELKLGLAEMMVGVGADVTAADPHTGATPLHNAASWGAIGLTRYLIGAGADRGARDNTGRLPIHMIPRGSLEIFPARRRQLVRLLRKRRLSKN